MKPIKITEAVRLFGNKANLSRALGITQQAVGQWEGDRVPLLRGYQINDILAKRKESKKCCSK